MTIVRPLLVSPGHLHWYIFIYKPIIGLKSTVQYSLSSGDLFLLIDPNAHQKWERALGYFVPSAWNLSQTELKLKELVSLNVFNPKWKMTQSQFFSWSTIDSQNALLLPQRCLPSNWNFSHCKLSVNDKKLKKKKEIENEILVKLRLHK